MTVEQWIDRQREDGNEKKHFYVMELTSDHMADASRKVIEISRFYKFPG